MAGLTHRMLVVEDWEDTRNSLLMLFRLMGWTVSGAATVAEGLALLDSEPAPCCMIIDIDLPDGTGDQVVAKLRSMGLKTRVVVSSGTTNAAKLKAMAAHDPDVFLSKPLTIEAVWNNLIGCRVCEEDVDQTPASGTP